MYPNNAIVIRFNQQNILLANLEKRALFGANGWDSLIQTRKK